MDSPQARDERAYAIEFAHGALRHYNMVGPDNLEFHQRTTNLSTGDMLATAIEMLLDQVDPGGPKPWIGARRIGQQPTAPAAPATTVTITDVWDISEWRPGCGRPFRP